MLPENSEGVILLFSVFIVADEKTTTVIFLIPLYICLLFSSKISTRKVHLI